jgi:hypothetical protein
MRNQGNGWSTPVPSRWKPREFENTSEDDGAHEDKHTIASQVSRRRGAESHKERLFRDGVLNSHLRVEHRQVLSGFNPT